MGDPTIIYGLGATKAGTSWLYQYLAGHPECAMPYPKELHFFDRLDFPHQSHQFRALQKRRDQFERRLGRIAQGDTRRAELKERLAAVERYLPVLEGLEVAEYRNFMSQLGRYKRAVGDITPAYSLVSERRLREMAQLAPVTKFIYILRDPVARAWSNIRMLARSKADATDGDVVRVTDRLVRRMGEGAEPALNERSDYASALRRITAALPARDVFIEFYERLFRQDVLDRLCAFLGLSAHPADTKRRVHEGVALPLGDQSRTTLKAILAPQYAAVAARYGDLPRAWRINMEVA